MKSLSIKQPWGHLIASGLKDIENRSWPTKYRGKILIHASGQLDGVFNAGNNIFTIAQISVMSDKIFKDITGHRFEKGAIIGEVEIIDCTQNSNSIWAEPGQWHWQLANAIIYQKPLLNVKGKLSLWDYNIEGLKEWERDRGLGA